MDYVQRVLDSLKVFTGTGSENQEAGSETQEEKEKPEQLLDEVTIEGVANYIKNGHCECNATKLIYLANPQISAPIFCGSNLHCTPSPNQLGIPQESKDVLLLFLKASVISGQNPPLLMDY